MFCPKMKLQDHFLPLHVALQCSSSGPEAAIVISEFENAGLRWNEDVHHHDQTASTHNFF